MLKNTIIAILTILVVLFWLSADSDEDGYDDPNTVTIEYKCSTLDEYANVPPEILDECRRRNKDLTENTI